MRNILRRFSLLGRHEWGIALTVFVVCLIMYGISFVGSRAPPLFGSFFAIVLCLFMVFAYTRSFFLGTLFVLVELVAGSLGHLFVLPGTVPIRMMFFVIAVAATAIRLARLPKERLAFFRLLRRPEILYLGAVVVYGVVRGLRMHPTSLVVGDANAYGFFLLLPTFFLGFPDAEKKHRAVAIVLGATSATAVLTLLLLFLFTHATPEPLLRMIYTWVRDFGLGEITRAPGGFYRVFFQAHIWNFIVYLWSAALLAYTPKRLWLWLPASLSAAVVFISFSRTFWLSAAVTMACGVALVLLRRSLRPFFLRYLFSATLISVFGLMLPFALTRSVGSAAFARAGAVAGEAAIDSRFNLLPVMTHAIREYPIRGWGFGKSLTYVTKDPRLLVYFPDGKYTTTAFEWGWLDFWLKMGIAGVIAFAFLITHTLKRLWTAICSTDSPWISFALFLSLIGISIAHTFSPWLNHPLGIGLLLFVSVWLLSEQRSGDTATL